MYSAKLVPLLVLKAGHLLNLLMDVDASSLIPHGKQPRWPYNVRSHFPSPSTLGELAYDGMQQFYCGEVPLLT